MSRDFNDKTTKDPNRQFLCVYVTTIELRFKEKLYVVLRLRKVSDLVFSDMGLKGWGILGVGRNYLSVDQKSPRNFTSSSYYDNGGKLSEFR